MEITITGECIWAGGFPYF